MCKEASGVEKCSLLPSANYWQLSGVNLVMLSLLDCSRLVVGQALVYMPRDLKNNCCFISKVVESGF
jgi:hypothetical protein